MQTSLLQFLQLLLNYHRYTRRGYRGAHTLWITEFRRSWQARHEASCNGDRAVSILKSICRHWIAKYYTNLLAGSIVRFQSASVRRSFTTVKYQIDAVATYRSLSFCSVRSPFRDDQCRCTRTNVCRVNVSTIHWIVEKNKSNLYFTWGRWWKLEWNDV